MDREYCDKLNRKKRVKRITMRLLMTDEEIKAENAKNAQKSREYT